MLHYMNLSGNGDKPKINKRQEKVADVSVLDTVAAQVQLVK